MSLINKGTQIGVHLQFSGIRKLKLNRCPNTSRVQKEPILGQCKHIGPHTFAEARTNDFSYAAAELLLTSVIRQKSPANYFGFALHKRYSQFWNKDSHVR